MIVNCAFTTIHDIIANRHSSVALYVLYNVLHTVYDDDVCVKHIHCYMAQLR